MEEVWGKEKRTMSQPDGSLKRTKKEALLYVLGVKRAARYFLRQQFKPGEKKKENGKEKKKKAKQGTLSRPQWQAIFTADQRGQDLYGPWLSNTTLGGALKGAGARFATSPTSFFRTAGGIGRDEKAIGPDGICRFAAENVYAKTHDSVFGKTPCLRGGI